MGTSVEMGAAEDGRYEQWARRSGPPDNEVPVVVPVSAVLGRGDGVAVVLAGVAAASNSFSLTIGVQLRQQPEDDDLPRQVTASGPVQGHLLLGLEDADGRRVSTVQHAGWPPQVEDTTLTMTGRGGGGGGRIYDQEYWVSPLPADGPLRVVVRWDARGVPETVTEVDGAAVAAAGRGAVELWPWEAAVEPDHEEDRGRRPTDGWFSQP
ncbi:hypothetical protein [Nocardioides kribbensis]|uniref:hypothetical protein n=1 Tax=Nocardioides kribbensis TaxID=305517 RepID=UPI0032D9B9D7